MSGIGTLNEKPLHAALKQWYACPGDRFEVAVDGYFIDIVRDDLLVEIQTRNVSAIRSKLIRLAGSHTLRLIVPITQEKWIVRTANGGHGSVRRKSPARGRLEDVFHEAVSIPGLVAEESFSLEILLIREEEARRSNRRRNWRRRFEVIERRLLEVVDRRLFRDPKDWLALLPEGMESFTTGDLAEAKSMSLDLAQKMAYFLREGGLVESMGRRGRSNLYRVSGSRERPTSSG